MRTLIALGLGVLLPVLGLAGVGNAQSTVPISGVIQAVDCQGGTVSLASPDGVDTIAVAPFTAVSVNSQAASLCDLQLYIGSSATVWVVPNGNEFVATRIDAAGQVAVAPVQPEAVSPLPIVGVVLGTIAVGGLLYLIARDGDQYYRYPYYGEYYDYYYSPAYRPYFGYWPGAAPVVLAAAAITGAVLGITAIAGLDYLVVRDYDGHYVRYPYYGPYRARYYRPDYRVYAGPYRNAPVHFGDWHGTNVRPGAGAPYQRPGNYHPTYQRPGNYQPTYQRPGNYQPTYQRPGNYQPTYQRPGTQPTYQRPGNYQPTYQRPGTQPTYQRPGNYQPTYQRPGNYQPTYQRPGNYQPTYQRPGNYQPTYQRGGGNSGGGRGRQCSSSQQNNCQNR
jgi:hypothetical protein